MRVHAELHEACAVPTEVIVATPGIGRTADDWAVLQAQLAENYSLAAWDLPGHGQSPVPDDLSEYTRDRAIDDLDDVTAWTGATAPVMLGHSLGGYLTMAWAVARSSHAPEARPDAISPKALVLMATGPGFRDDEKRDAWNARSRRNAHRFGVPPQAAELNCQEDSIVIERIPQLNVPTLVLVGSEDRPDIAGGCGYLAKKMPNATLVTIDGGDHLMHEHPDHSALIADQIRAFLVEL